MRLRIPPGRSGRLWLRSRLQAATKAAELLDHKRRELETELTHVRGIAGRREEAWRGAAEEAKGWLGRVDLTGGDRSLPLVATLSSGEARVRVEWRHVMGVHYPVDHHTSFPSPARVAMLEGGAALVGAQAAYRKAVDAAVAHAVAWTAVSRIRADIDRTIRRLRALELRAIPAHESALAALELALDEKDREEAVAARWAVQQSRPSTRTREGDS
jgi:V/A-type H+-transporting ATPase subunit D